MVDRLDAARKLLRKHNCTHLLVSDPIDCEYLSGFRSSSIFILLGRKSQFLLTDFRYRQTATEFCRTHPGWKFVEVSESSFSTLSSLISRGSRLGIESNTLTVDQFDQLKKHGKNAKLVKLSSGITELFRPKLPSEIRQISRAARIGDTALEQTLPAIRLGMTELELQKKLESKCAELGSEGPSFETIVLFGKRSALPHGVPSKRRLRKGDWILIDFGCTVKGFCSDMTRTMVAGDATEKQREMYSVVQEAQRRGRRAVREKIPASEVDRFTREFIDEQGYAESFGHATGHGVGRRIHEGPRVSRKDSSPLSSGMVITVEPGVYLPELGGVRIEDMVCVTPTGGRVLTHFPRELLEIDL